mmetsp:Transcript_10134/g.22363  ORF Transcript_10134/g.22363 Transcript_10134/m.22363 type:complete len:157 (+) Transcript_10134:53-523(+)|eukprot:CAMPEP_0204269796 /NCGR_PEP_ID=MMETSP0468-20130131/17232_1 /ASSEMBLY_ACC=CAM_ASM_000383 /TAXON_ID=2969 /ORGANISM="Oxyrrhis marina" /LENGTH=156 /DNA_ID=CAMNT_0051245237 /DNA_START=48 /DNA_END=518 /DNA_ORIENTATION=-
MSQVVMERGVPDDEQQQQVTYATPTYQTGGVTLGTTQAMPAYGGAQYAAPQYYTSTANFGTASYAAPAQYSYQTTTAQPQYTTAQPQYTYQTAAAPAQYTYQTAAAPAQYTYGTQPVEAPVQYYGTAPAAYGGQYAPATEALGTVAQKGKKKRSCC